MNFAITPKTIPTKETIAEVENAVKDLDKAEGDNIRAKISLTLQNAQQPEQNLSKEERKTLNSLKSLIFMLELQRQFLTFMIALKTYWTKSNTKCLQYA